MGIGKLSDGLAPTPPMGWNSWNRFGVKIDERLVLETAEAIVESGMRDAGYRYVVIDDGWMAPDRDRNGDFVADPAKFPSGIAALAERIHALGLQFGIYTKNMPGPAGKPWVRVPGCPPVRGVGRRLRESGLVSHRRPGPARVLREMGDGDPGDEAADRPLHLRVGSSATLGVGR